MSIDLIAYPDIDAVLGDRAGRFFGEGYKRIDHRIFDITLGGDAQGRPHLSAVAGVAYPLDWSRKSTRVLEPHLSSIDCAIFGYRLLAVLLRECCGLTEAEITRCWMPYVQFSSGTTATESLDEFPITVTVTEMSDASLTLTGALGSSMTLEATVALPNAPRPCSRELRTVHEHGGGYYDGPVYQRGQYLRDLVVTEDIGTVAAAIQLTETESPTGLVGVADAYQPCACLVDTTVILAQLSQVLLYQLDNIARRDSETLWMRRMTARAATPPASIPTTAATRMVRSMVLTFGGGPWRISTWEAEFADCEIRYDLAHRLPA